MRSRKNRRRKETLLQHYASLRLRLHIIQLINNFFPLNRKGLSKGHIYFWQNINCAHQSLSLQFVENFMHKIKILCIWMCMNESDKFFWHLNQILVNWNCSIIYFQPNILELNIVIQQNIIKFYEQKH